VEMSPKLGEMERFDRGEYLAVSYFSSVFVVSGGIDVYEGCEVDLRDKFEKYCLSFARVGFGECFHGC
jgi:hypothetical protein